MMTFSTSDRYVGIPWRDGGRGFDGVDCYGLQRLVYACELGIELPSYAGAYVCVEERREIAALISDGASARPWRRVDEIQPFDGLLFRTNGEATHIGVAIDAQFMLHAHLDQVKVDRIVAPHWRNRLVGVWRHAEVPS